MAFRSLSGVYNFARKRETYDVATRYYARWTHRTPSKVILPVTETDLKKEHVIELDPSVLQKSREAHAAKLNGKDNPANSPAILKQRQPKKFITEVVKDSATVSEEVKKTLGEDVVRKRKNQQRPVTHDQNNTNVFDENGEIIYTKLKDNDGRISLLLTKLKSRKERGRLGQVMVEGWRLIVDGLQAGCPLDYVIFSRPTDLSHLKPFLPKTGVKLYKIPYKEIELWSNVDTPPGIIGVFKIPTAENIIRRSKYLPLKIICDNIRTPGNLGAILRAAVGVGCDQVFLIKGCVDLWDSKVVRSAAGAHFRLPVHSSIEWEKIPKLIDPNSSVFIADNNNKVLLNTSDNEVSNIDNLESLNIPVLPYYGVEFGPLKSLTLIIGGETEGISEDSYRFAASRNGIRLNIPLQGGVDSLNTGMATAVIAFEIKKQLLEHWTKLKTNSNVIL